MGSLIPHTKAVANGRYLAGLLTKNGLVKSEGLATPVFLLLLFVCLFIVVSRLCSLYSPSIRFHDYQRSLCGGGRNRKQIAVRSQRISPTVPKSFCTPDTESRHFLSRKTLERERICLPFFFQASGAGLI